MKRAVMTLAGLAAAAVLGTAGWSASPAAANGQPPRTLFIADAEPGVPLLPNDVAVVEGPDAIVSSRIIYERELFVHAEGPSDGPNWFTRVVIVPAGAPWTGTRTGMWQAGTFGETTYLTLVGGPFSQGCQRSSSEFTIHELEAAPDGNVTKLALSFTWHCDGAVPAVYGEVRINSTVPVAALRADRTQVGFQPVAVGVAAPDQVVKLENPGSTDMAPTVRLTGLDADAFAIATDSCTGTTVAPGSTCEISVRYTPVHPGPARAFLEIVDGAPRGVRTVDLDGTTVP